MVEEPRKGEQLVWVGAISRSLQTYEVVGEVAGGILLRDDERRVYFAEPSEVERANAYGLDVATPRQSFGCSPLRCKFCGELVEAAETSRGDVFWIHSSSDMVRCGD